jgi:N-acetylglucosaminyldiphosphoundecaprenol N-acetyl-beta-D-mannosaminyltransferase
MNDSMRLQPSRIELLGVFVDVCTGADLVRLIDDAIAHDDRVIIGNHNLHSIYLAHHDSFMGEFARRCDYCFIDGMPIIAVARLLGYPVTREHRLGGIWWLRTVLGLAAANGWRVYFVGGLPGAAAKAAGILRREIPGLQLEVEHGYFDIDDESANRMVSERIAFHRPHILIVGMGMPRQERWILENLHRIQANAVLNQGAILDYVAGVIPTPPRWLSTIGLEWLARLLAEPRRLGRRYLVEPWFLIPILMSDVRRHMSEKLRRTLRQRRRA